MKKYTGHLIAFLLFLGQIQAMNNALHFNGTDNVTINHGSNSLSGTFTIEFWANPSSLSGQGFLGSRGPSDASLDIQLTSTGGLHGDIGNGSGWLTTSADAPGAGLQVGVWSHIAYVITPTGYTIYVNAVQKGSGSFNGTPLAFSSSHIMTLGNYGTGGSTYNGALDELRIWSVARTASEILNNMNTELSAGTGLVAAYHFNQGVAGGNNSGVTNLEDATGTYSGTLNTFALMGSTSNWISGAASLPVELKTFTATFQQESVLLRWNTASETNNQGFEIQHSTNGINWQALGFIAGYGTTLDEKHYTFLHRSPHFDKNYYRLRQMDFDGASEFSKTVFVSMENGKVKSCFFPTVTSGVINIESDWDELGQISVFSASGQLVMSTGQVSQLDLSALENGMYLVQLKSEKGIVTERILKH